MTEAKKPLAAWKNFATAGIGGIAGWCGVHPFNTLAMRMTCAPPGSVSTLGMLKSILKNEGALSLYNGLSAGCVRQIFYASSRVGLYDVFKDLTLKHLTDELTLFYRFSLATVAGGCAAVISCPAEVSLIRMATDNRLPVAERRNYSSVVDAFVKIQKTEGVATFWRGCAPFVMRCCLVGGTQVGSYDQFKVVFEKKFGWTGNKNYIASSLSAGLLYSLITMPFETSKNRMAAEKPAPGQPRVYTGTFRTLGLVASKEGVMSLWSGFLPYYGRCGGHTVLMFLLMEQMRKALE